MFGPRLFLMHPRNSVFCGQSFQIFSSLSNSQSLDFSQKCSKYQQLCREKVNKGSASKVKHNWRRSLFGFGCHIFSQVLAAQSEMLTQKLQDWKKMNHFVHSKWIPCDASVFCHLRRVATWIYMRLAMKPWSWWVTLVEQLQWNIWNVVLFM